ncbi:MAG: nucleotidyltransferase family protein [Gammaproteobacteria bacterium]|nr:nucleotidyltransferase family protein [Gammaproteobacteria bacterium]
MKAIVLAGGLGTRLKERIADIPKPMAPVGERPFLEYLLDQLIIGGINEIILSVGFRADVIIDHFGESYRNASLSYAVETEPLGTGGAIVHAMQEHITDPVIVLNGDTFLNIDYRSFLQWYSTAHADVAMILRDVPDASRYGSVTVTNGRVSGFKEKCVEGAGLINAGIYIINPGSLKSFDLPNRFSFETDFLQRYYSKIPIKAYITNAYFIDIGIPDDYDRAQQELPLIT